MAAGQVPVSLYFPKLSVYLDGVFLRQKEAMSFDIVIEHQFSVSLCSGL